MQAFLKNNFQMGETAVNTRFSRGKTSFLLPLEKNFFIIAKGMQKNFPLSPKASKKENRLVGKKNFKRRLDKKFDT